MTGLSEKISNSKFFWLHGSNMLTFALSSLKDGNFELDEDGQKGLKTNNNPLTPPGC